MDKTLLNNQRTFIENHFSHHLFILVEDYIIINDGFVKNSLHKCFKIVFKLYSFRIYDLFSSASHTKMLVKTVTFKLTVAQLTVNSYYTITYIVEPAIILLSLVKNLRTA